MKYLGIRLTELFLFCGDGGQSYEGQDQKEPLDQGDVHAGSHGAAWNVARGESESLGKGKHKRSHVTTLNVSTLVSLSLTLNL